MKNIKFLVGLATVMLLSSCQIVIGSNTTSSGESSTLPSISDTGNNSSNSTTPPSTTTTPPSSTSSSTNQDQGVHNNTIRAVNEQLGWSTLASTGNQKMLVVPVQLSGQKVWTSTMLSNLEAAFFGDSEDTTWESVSSFYRKSSWGALNISGELTDPYVSSYTYNQLYNYGDNSSDYLINEWSSRNSLSNSKLKEYDQDKDGRLDCTVFIYSNSYDSNGVGFWAWCFYQDNNPNTSKPVVNNYMWASYDFLTEGYVDGFNSSKVDAHTFIHESGHLLGLDDYYCYDESNSWDAAGQLEMQSYNVGDQNIYSKFALGWFTPTHASTSTSATYTIDTSATHPQALLINDSWNGTPFDEYLILEYYTPTGLNETDANHRYDTRDTMYNYRGIRLYHVDARLIKMDSRGNFMSYVDSIGNDGYAYFVGASNSYSYSYLNSPYNSVYRYVHLLDQGGRNRLNNGLGGSITKSMALWTQGNTFTPSSTFFYNGTRFNNGNVIGYSITVTQTTTTQATITITKI